MANIFGIDRPTNKITLGTTGTTINIASHTASKTLALNASKELESVQDIRTTASPTFAGLSVANGGTIAPIAGSLNLITNEGTNTDTVVEIKGKGTGRGHLKIHETGGDNCYLGLEGGSTGGVRRGYIHLVGTSRLGLFFQSDGGCAIHCFSGSKEGVTQEFKIWGYRTGDIKRKLEISTGINAVDTASFDGLSNYYFNGVVDAVGGFKDNGTIGVDGTFLDQGGNMITVNGGIITNLGV